MKPFFTPVSAACFLFVCLDGGALELISAQTRGNSNAVTVTFSADVTEASATNAANYSVNNGVSVSNVVMLESGKVRLFTSLIGTEPEWNPSRSWLSSLNGRLQVPTTFVAGGLLRRGRRL